MHCVKCHKEYSKGDLGNFVGVLKLELSHAVINWTFMAFGHVYMSIFVNVVYANNVFWQILERLGMNWDHVSQWLVQGLSLYGCFLRQDSSLDVTSQTSFGGSSSTDKGWKNAKVTDIQSSRHGQLSCSFVYVLMCYHSCINKGPFKQTKTRSSLGFIVCNDHSRNENSTLNVSSS